MCRGGCGALICKHGFYGLAATLLTVVFLALAGEPRAEGATRSRRARWAGCWAWTGLVLHYEVKSHPNPA